ncbi:MAG: peptidoglycan-associated lipoprotein Pal [Gammaproteobacteria bacterium]
MKKRVFILYATLSALALAASGCGTTVANYSGDIQDEKPSASSAAAADSAESSREPEFAASPPAAADASGGLLDRRRIHFEYDKSAVADSALPVIAAHSDYLNRNPSRRVILEGHADERGSNEYNLALGQRRADSVRDIMLANGVGAGQIETLSFGEESPVAFGQNEADWAQNRRVEIRYYNE